MDIVIDLLYDMKKDDGKALESYLDYMLKHSTWSDYIVNVELNY